MDSSVYEKIESAFHRSPFALHQFASRNIEIAAEMANDPLNMNSVRRLLQEYLLTHPLEIFEERLWRLFKYTELTQYTWARILGMKPPPVIIPKLADHRWKNEEWTRALWFDVTKQGYLIWARSIERLVSGMNLKDLKTKKRILFYTKLFTDSWSPSNFPWSNPEVMLKTFSSFGENLIDGYLRFIDDVEKGKGLVAPSNVNTAKFKVGETVAITPGKVVFQNDLMQLIQYSPTTSDVARTPLLVIPAWINKYYILDLQPHNSLIRYMVGLGYTVFVISWVNPGPEMAYKKFEDYMLEGPIEAIDQIKDTTKVEDIHLVGYCLGGTLTAATAAYLAAKSDFSVRSMTLLTTLIDFSEPGDLGFFIDEKQVSTLEHKMAERGYLGAEEMTAAFNLLRSNDLLFQSAVSHYFLDKEPTTLDFLAWNADSTRMPFAMHSFYLRKMYIENALAKPNALSLFNTPINLGSIKCPIYFLSSKDDHIAPWTSVYSGVRLFGGPQRFVLSESGHIAGVINPPEAKKYNHWINDTVSSQAQDWFDHAALVQGSWWTDWGDWMAKNFSDQRVPATHREPATGSLLVIEDAPGSYVKEK